MSNTYSRIADDEFFAAAGIRTPAAGTDGPTTETGEGSDRTTGGGSGDAAASGSAGTGNVS
ncbi:hypothetical protein GCM10010191_10170 [Actinomadura vinacea]|uniref:Uncharacterized protein n=1 Tax=Actinomadura vinacea TaxID=115336 RepID=A0ABN3II05_9ACTN